MTGDPEPISPHALEQLQHKLADLRTERAAVAATFRSDDVAGDAADAADELQRATDATRLDGRIAELETRIRQAEIAGPPPEGVIGVGSSVTVRFSDGGESTLRVGEVADELDPTLVTADSPLGRALLGRRAGDSVSYLTPQGEAGATVVSLGG
ncbi:GreA/GreB family elongation factor [Streptomyces polyrhachis]|uniref:GreA/GreB family elongation factor n=1 Tax=Streptomyces polyrhachis TaxID=1282885 RepID=A0ABW2GHK2_9ACTN